MHGDAEIDADFAAAGDRVRYAIPAQWHFGPYRLSVELLYQSIGYRWANNLKRYDAPEPRRFTSFYDSMADATATTLARASVTVP